MVLTYGQHVPEGIKKRKPTKPVRIFLSSSEFSLRFYYSWNRGSSTPSTMTCVVMEPPSAERQWRLLLEGRWWRCNCISFANNNNGMFWGERTTRTATYRRKDRWNDHDARETEDNEGSVLALSILFPLLLKIIALTAAILADWALFWIQTELDRDRETVGSSFFLLFFIYAFDLIIWPTPTPLAKGVLE